MHCIHSLCIFLLLKKSLECVVLKIVFFLSFFFCQTHIVGQRDYGPRSDAGKETSSEWEWIVALKSLLLKCLSRKMDVAAIPMAQKKAS